MDDYAAFFQRLTGFAPLPFQSSVAEHILAGRNLIITAPTGSGKTWAVVAPYLYALESGEPIADRLLYALPLRSLADSLFGSLQKRLAETSVHDLDPITDIRMQSGSSKEDPFFLGKITFTTLDQLLSGYLTVPVSLGDRLGNINAGALPGAAVVFDEVHLLQPTQALGTAIEMGVRLGSLTQLTLMTATLPQECVDILCATLHAQHIGFTDADLAQAPHLRDRSRLWTWIDRPMTATDVLDEHQGGRTLAICNTVARAQRLFREIQDHPRRSGSTGCILLHSRFLPADRKNHETSAEPSFARDADKTDIIAVTTQVVEAGMDWGADTLHSELAPANALVQRAGRCARFPWPRNRGRVYVYELEHTAEGVRAAGPYRNPDGSPLATIESTYLAVKDYHAADVNAVDERVLVEHVHQAADVAALQAVVNNLPRRARTIEESMFDSGDRARLSELVRDADSVNVVVTSEPEILQLDRGPISVSVSRFSLSSLDRVLATPTSGWMAKQPNISDDGVVTWAELRSLPEIMRVAWYLALAPTIAGYSSDHGLVFGAPGGETPVSYAERPPRLAGQYTIERWSDHALRVAGQAKIQQPRWRRAAQHLELRYQLPAGTAASLLDLVCLLHDFGKLSGWWQDAMQGWQRVKNAGALVAMNGAPLAHTDFNPRTDAERQRREFRQPYHAMEGAYAASDIVETRVSELDIPDDAKDVLARCLVSAIARHHGPRTRSISRFRWIPSYRDDLATVLGAPPVNWQPRTFAERDLEAEAFCSRVVMKAADEQDRPWLPMYWFLVRNLRLADQASQAMRREA